MHYLFISISFSFSLITAGGENVEILNNTIQNTRGTALQDSVVLEKNTVTHAPIIKFGPYGYPKPTNISNVKIKRNDIQTEKGVIAIDTTNAGTDAPSYYFENNKIGNGTLK